MFRAAYRVIDKYILSNSGKLFRFGRWQSRAKSGTCRKGVETVWQASLVDEETVQTANPKGATKVVVVRITDWSMVQVHPPPPLNPLLEDFYYLLSSWLRLRATDTRVQTDNGIIQPRERINKRVDRIVCKIRPLTDTAL